MYTLSVWDRDSTDYGASRFHFQRGTNTFHPKSRHEALQLFNDLSHTVKIDRIDLDGPEGSLVWQRSLCMCDECVSDRDGNHDEK